MPAARRGPPGAHHLLGRQLQVRRRPHEGVAERAGSDPGVGAGRLDRSVGVDQPVGVEGEHVAGRQLHLLLPELPPAGAERAVTGGEGTGGPARGEDRREVAGVRDAAGAQAGVVHRVCAGHDPCLGQAADDPVEVAEHLRGGQLEGGERPYRRLELPRRHGRPEAAPLHVAGDQRRPPRGERDHVQPVAAGLGVGPGGLVPPDELESFDLGRPAGQQAAPEGGRGAPLAGEGTAAVLGVAEHGEDAGRAPAVVADRTGAHVHQPGCAVGGDGGDVPLMLGTVEQRGEQPPRGGPARGGDEQVE
ncbi:MAG TPA: hypothetical protein VKP11_08065, partial [Frankiaceae bacterium]|nr:hypothetical protein [Frankiaceae bacterium]